MSFRSAAVTDRELPVDPGDLALVRCHNAGRAYGGGATTVSAVAEVTCQVPAEARIAITGSSGSGKSTLLHLLAGLERPNSGSVTWPALNGPPHGRPGRIGVIFQAPSLLPALDATENVALPLLLAGVPAAEATARAHRALDRLGIGDLAPQLPEEMSGGQAQRVAAARVLAGAPRLILADEPTGQLDHDAGDLVMSVLIEAADELRAALVVSTHDPVVAARLPGRWTMRDGRLTETMDGSTH